MKIGGDGKTGDQENWGTTCTPRIVWAGGNTRTQGRGHSRQTGAMVGLSSLSWSHGEGKT